MNPVIILKQTQTKQTNNKMSLAYKKHQKAAKAVLVNNELSPRDKAFILNNLAFAEEFDMLAKKYRSYNEKMEISPVIDKMIISGKEIETIKTEIYKPIKKTKFMKEF